MSRRDEEVAEVDHLLAQPKGEVDDISHHQDHLEQDHPHDGLPPHGQERKLLRVFIQFDRSRRGEEVELLSMKEPMLGEDDVEVRHLGGHPKHHPLLEGLQQQELQQQSPALAI